MLVFIDESGNPHPNDAHTRPVVVAVCISEKDSRLISGRIHALKRDLLQQERIELKAVNLLNRPTYRRKPEVVEFANEFFTLVMNLPVTIFAAIMQGPFQDSDSSNALLPNRFRYLLQRIELLAEERNDMATLLFDGQPNLYGNIGQKFNSYLFRSDEGRACVHITDAPNYVDSKSSVGIQIADMTAAVLRKYEEAGLYHSAPPAGDPYSFAIRRWYQLLAQKTRNDLVTRDGHSRAGFYRLSIGEA